VLESECVLDLLNVVVLRSASAWLVAANRFQKVEEDWREEKRR
jgi:hypothetical protein